jgi:hypothetical protein
MAAQRVPQNLPPQSQQWVRDVERRMEALERQNALLQITANRNAAQVGNIMSALSGVESTLAVIASKVTTSSVSIAISSTGAKTESTFTAPSWATGALVSFNYGGYTGAPADGNIRVVATASNESISAGFTPADPTYVRAGDVAWVGAPTYAISQVSTSFCPVVLGEGQSNVYARPYVTQMTTGSMTMQFNYVILWM